VQCAGQFERAHGFRNQDEKRKALKRSFASGVLFDGVTIRQGRDRIDRSGGFRPEFVPEEHVSNTGGPGDKCPSPTRAAYGDGARPAFRFCGLFKRRREARRRTG